MSRRNISVGAWNINGIKSRLGNKLEDCEVHDAISKQDIVILTETHTDGNDNIFIENFTTYNFSRPKNKAAIRNSGGIAILFRNSLKMG